MHTHDGNTFDNSLTLTFDLGSMHARRLLCTVHLPSLVLVLIAQTRTHRQTRTKSEKETLMYHHIFGIGS